MTVLASTAVADATALLAELVAIDSVNPDLDPRGGGEAAIARYVADWLAGRGLDVSTLEFAPGRTSVVGVARGRGGGRSLLLNAHLDTVGVGDMADAHRPRVEAGRLRGRGAYDMKAGLASIMLAGAAAVEAGLAGDVIVTAVADEEFGSRGCEQLLEHWRADAAIVTEPTGLELCLAHKGFVWTRFVVAGRAAHGSRPDLGIDAVLDAVPLLAALRKRAQSLATGGREHLLLGRGSLHVGTIHGGQEPSSYPAECVLEVERRTVPGETLRTVEAEVDELLAALRAALPRLSVTAATTMARAPFETAPDAPLARALQRHAQERLGRPIRHVGEGPWMDSGLISAAGIPTAVFGPGGGGAHSAEEWVELADVSACADVLLAVAREHCGAADEGA